VSPVRVNVAAQKAGTGLESAFEPYIYIEGLPLVWADDDRQPINGVPPMPDSNYRLTPSRSSAALTSRTGQHSVVGGLGDPHGSISTHGADRPLLGVGG
jgi:hypothetical protein